MRVDAECLHYTLSLAGFVDRAEDDQGTNLLVRRPEEFEGSSKKEVYAPALRATPCMSARIQVPMDSLVAPQCARA